MIKLTEFTSVVDTYKKNFAIRKKRFSREKTDDLGERRENREKRIETSKLFDEKKLKQGVKKRGGNITDTLLRFGLFTLLGFLLKNIDKIALGVKAVVEKIKEFVKKAQIFYDETLVPFFESLRELGTILGPTLNFLGDFLIEMNPFKELSSLLDTVMYGILGIATRLGLKSQVKPRPQIPQTPSSFRKAPVKAPVQAPAKVPKPVVTGARNAALSETARRRSIAKTFLRSRTAVGAGSISQGLPVGASLGDQNVFDTFKQNLEAARQRAAEQRLNDSLIKDAINEKARRDAAFFKSVGIDGGDKFYKANLAQIADDIPLRAPGLPFTSIDKLIGKPPNNPNFFTDFFDRAVEGTRRGGQQLKNFGMGFKFNPKDVLNFFKNPRNLKDLAKGSIFGLAFEAGLKAIGSSISDSLPFSENFQTLAYFGLIKKERIFQLKAEQLAKMSVEERNQIIQKMLIDAKSNPFFLDSIGLANKERATQILQNLAPILASQAGITTSQEVQDIFELFQPPQSPSSLPTQPTQPFNINAPTPNPNKKADEDNFRIDGTKINIGDTVGSIQMDTTYSSGGVRTIANNVIVLQTIREEVPV